MASQITANTGQISLTDAKKLWKVISEKSKAYSLTEIGCEGGADIEVANENVSKDDLKKINLPETCRCLVINADASGSISDLKFSEKNHSPLDLFFLGGAEITIPDPSNDYGWVSNVRVNLLPKNLNFSLLFAFEIQNVLKYMGRKFDKCFTIGIQYFPRNESAFFGTEEIEKPSDEEIDKAINQIWDTYNMPNNKDRGLLEEVKLFNSRRVHIDPETCGWGWSDFKNMLVSLTRDSPSDKIFFKTRSC